MDRLLTRLAREAHVLRPGLRWLPLQLNTSLTNPLRQVLCPIGSDQGKVCYQIITAGCEQGEWLLAADTNNTHTPKKILESSDGLYSHMMLISKAAFVRIHQNLFILHISSWSLPISNSTSPSPLQKGPISIPQGFPDERKAGGGRPEGEFRIHGLQLLTKSQWLLERWFSSCRDLGLVTNPWPNSFNLVLGVYLAGLFSSLYPQVGNIQEHVERSLSVKPPNCK